MFYRRLLTALVLIASAQIAGAQELIKETTEQRDARMGWWRDAQFGMFIHWGAYAIPAGVYKGELYFLCHKKVSQLVGFESSQHWFSEEFRAKHAGSDR